jgi:hypothetical protein
VYSPLRAAAPPPQKVSAPARPRQAPGALQRKTPAPVIQPIYLKRGRELTHFQGGDPPKAGLWLHFGQWYNNEKVYEEITGVEMPKLDKSKDFHYGINPPDGETLGHRAKSMDRYGGSVGEYTFSPNSYQNAQKPNPNIDEYQKQFNLTREVKGKHRHKYRGGGIKNFPTPNKTVSKYIDYDQDATERTADQFGEVIGTRFSKGVIAYAARVGGSVRFHLDGMGTKEDLLKLINKTHTEHSNAVTSRELRFVYKYWNGGLHVPGLTDPVRLQDVVVFYKKNRSVHPPWSSAYAD